MAEYREIKEKERQAQRDLLNYAFQPEKGRENDEEEGEISQIGFSRGMFEGDKLLCVCTNYTLKGFIRGERLPMGLVIGVASRPEVRRQGNVGEMLTELLYELRERGVFLSALWPFSYEFYRQYGWELADSRRYYEIEPGNLEQVNAPKGAGRYREVSLEDLELIGPIYERFARDFNLSLDRDEGWWDHHVFDHWGDKAFGYLWEEGGTERGYLLYTVKKLPQGEWKKELNVRELAYLDPGAYRHLLRFLYHHDSQVTKVTFRAPRGEEVGLFDVLDNPRQAEMELEPGVMFRVVDLERAVEELQFPPDLEGQLTLSIRDETLPWNDGKFLLEVRNGRARLEEREGGGKADLEVPITALAQIYAGYLSPVGCFKAGKLSVNSEGKLELFEEFFPREKVFLLDHF